MKTVKYAIIGSGMMGKEHISNIALLEGPKVVALADPNDVSLQESSEKVAKYWEEPTCYKDFKEMLEYEDLDAVVIAAPNFEHVDIFEYICQHYPNLAILLEKPACTTKEDAHKLKGCAKDHQAPIWVAMEYRYMPIVSQLVKDVRDHKIGTLKTLAIREHRFPFLEKVNDWNRFNEKTGGTLVEKCCHFFDLMNHITQGKALRVYASAHNDVNHLDEQYNGCTPDIIDNAFVIVEYDNNIRASLDLCMFAEGSYFQEEIAVVGDEAKLEAFVPAVQRFWPGALENPDQAPKPKYVFSPRSPKGPKSKIIEADPKILKAGDHQGSTFYQHQKFLEAILGNGQIEVGLKQGIDAVLIGLAAEESAKTHKVVELNL